MDFQLCNQNYGQRKLVFLLFICNEKEIADIFLFLCKCSLIILLLVEVRDRVGYGYLGVGS